MGKFGGLWPILVLVATILVSVECVTTDKDNPNILLRPPGQGGGNAGQHPVFSSSIDAVPVTSGSQTQNVYSKGPSIVHSTASASASGGGGIKDTGSHGGRNNGPWYNQGSNSGFSFDYNAGADTGSATNAVHSTSGGSGYYEPPPQQISSSSSSASVDSYAPPSNPGGVQNPSYTYYYQHYPSSSSISSHGWSGGGGGDDGFFGGGGDGGLFGGLGAGGGALAGAGVAKAGAGVVKAVKVVAAIAKGILAVKPFLILGLLILIAIPVLLLLLPIPIITITGQPALVRSGRSRSSQLTSYLTQLSGKVLNSEECLERIICKLPQPPEKYQTKAKLIWDEYGSRMVSSPRVSRGLNAYFEGSSQKNRNLKCDQRFKCSNKYL